jgi:hypothetical protein
VLDGDERRSITSHIRRARTQASELVGSEPERVDDVPV